MNSIGNYTETEIDHYLKMLSALGSLSKLYSDSKIPLIYYRATEKFYCDCFKARDISRKDVPADAIYGNIGVGIKTFIDANKSNYQKIEEFDAQKKAYDQIEDTYDLIMRICELRNNVLGFTMSEYSLSRMIFHCVVRDEGLLQLYEEPMNYIDCDNITISKVNNSTIHFSDGLSDYAFNKSKSTLYKKFEPNPCFAKSRVKIIEEPSKLLINLVNSMLEEYNAKPTIVIPLYGIKSKKRVVFERSGLNQWNANGRPRDINEVYIPFPVELKKRFPDFFPGKEIHFETVLPNNRILSMKICQQGGKAIMSTPNRELGKWLLRDLLHLDPEKRELVTYETLLEKGIDSVIFSKQGDQYYLNFGPVNCYEDFKKNDFKYVEKKQDSQQSLI